MTIHVTESRPIANGLHHHVITWDGGERGEVLLTHGFLDLAWSFDALARRLAGEGFRVVAFDWRGHGESDWIGPGGYYHFFDYLLDLDELTRQLFDRPFHLLGHSMGGTACSYFAGLRSSRLASLTLVEGLGPPESTASQPDRVLAWFETLDKQRSRRHRPLRDLDAAVDRMRIQNPEVSDELGSFLAARNTQPNPDGAGIVWRFDPYHRTHSPVGFRVDTFLEFLHRIEVATLIVGASRGFRLPDELDRAGHIRDYRLVEIPDCGHMIHWFRPDALADAILEFLEPDATLNN